MLETLKKKWWLVAIVVVIGGVLLNNAGIINKSAEKTLKSQDSWAVTVTDPTRDESMDMYFKFVENDVYVGMSLDSVTDVNSADKAQVQFVDKKTITISSDDEDFKRNIPGGKVTFKFDDVSGPNMKASLVVSVGGMEVNMPSEFVPGNKAKGASK